MFALSGTSWRPANGCLQVAVLVFAACAHAPSGAVPAPPSWVKGHPSTQDGRLYTVARGGPTGMPSDARKVALERGARNLARSLGEVSVVARTYDHLTESGGSKSRSQSAMGEESETLIKAVLQDLRVEAEWIDPNGRYSGVDGRVYYLLLSIPHKGTP